MIVWFESSMMGAKIKLLKNEDKNRSFGAATRGMHYSSHNAGSDASFNTSI